MSNKVMFQYKKNEYYIEGKLTGRVLNDKYEIKDSYGSLHYIKENMISFKKGK